MNFTGNNSFLKGGALICAGIVLAFVPGFISWLLTIAGIAVILFNGFRLISAKSSSDRSGKYIGGIIFGIILVVAPRLLSFAIPVIVGIYVAFNGAETSIRAVERKKQQRSWLFSFIVGAVTFFIGVAICFNPYDTSSTVTKILGIILIIAGVFSLFGKGGSTGTKSVDSSVIDVEGYCVDDDDIKRLE